jgi:tRNA ligase
MAWSDEKYPATTAPLLTELRAVRETHPKAVRSTPHKYPASIYDDQGAGSSKGKLPDRDIVSWKMTEHMYRDSNNPFPTLARGLFTEDIDAQTEVPVEALQVEGTWPEGATRTRIVARGYDKFFNTGEVSWTEVGVCFIGSF